MTSILKYCPRCKQEKPIDTAFHKNKARYDGVAPVCKRCRSSNKKRFDAKKASLKYCPMCNRAFTHEQFYGPNITNFSKTGYCIECRSSSIYRKKIKLAEKGIKICTSCNEEKPYSKFNKDKNRADGFYPYCKICSNKTSIEHYQKNKKHYQKIHKEWYFANPGYSRHRNNKRRALQRKAEGSYTKEEFETLCQHYGNICLCCGKKKKLTVDHIIPLSKGGKNSIDNIQPLCLTCNKKKATKTIDYRPMEQALP